MTVPPEASTLVAVEAPSPSARRARTSLAEPAPSIATVLRSPRFGFLVVGQTVSQLGDKLHHMALIALVGAAAASNTGGLELAKLSVVFTAPVILFGPLAGALVDRWNKRTTMIVCDALRALLVLIIPALFVATGHLWTVYVVAFLTFLLGVFFNSAKMALIPELVPRSHLLSANAALSFIGRFATVLGVVGGGVIIGLAAWGRIGWSDYEAGFYLDGGSYLVSVLTLLAISVTGRNRVEATAESADRALRGKPRRTLRSLARDVVQTLRTVQHDRALRFVFGSLISLALFASTVYVAMTYSVQTVMGLGTKGVGYLGGILGAGMILGSLVVGTIGRRWNKQQAILLGNSTIGVLMVIAGVFFSFAIFVPVAFLGGALLAPVMVSQDTMLHENAPADARALIFSTKDLIVASVFMIAALAVGGLIFVLGSLGVTEPYRFALGGVGAVIVLAGISGQVLLRRAPQHESGD